MIPFRGYNPDQPPLDNGGEIVALNVFPLPKGYGPIPKLQAITTAMDSRARGAVVIKDRNGSNFIYAGDEKKLYVLTQAAQTEWTNISGMSYSTAEEDMWEFVKFKEKVIATNFADPMQVLTIGGASFADLVSEPKGRHIGVVRSFVVLGNTTDTTDGNIPYRVQWSAIDDETSWTVSPTTLADFQDLPGSGGWVKKVIGGEYGTVFQERSIWRMTFRGSPTVFQFDEVQPGIGTPASGSVVQLGNRIFFLGQDGFRVIINGVETQLIGKNRVDATFFDDLDDTYTYRITAAADPTTNRIFWAYPGTGNANGRPNKVLIYDVSLNEWSSMEEEIQLFAVQATGGFTLDSLDTFALGSELVNNGDFSSDTVWTKGGRWTISGGAATHTP